MDAGPAMRAAKRVPQRAVIRVQGRGVRPRLVQPAGLRNADSPRRLVAVQRVQQRNLLGQRQLRGKLPIRPGAEQGQAAGKRQQVQVAAQVGPPHRGRQTREGTECQQVADAAQRLALAPAIRRRPRRQRLFAPIGFGRLVVRENAEARPPQVGQRVRRFAIRGGQQPAEHVFGPSGRQLAARGAEETPPERAARPLFARAEQRPAHAALVVLACATAPTAAAARNAPAAGPPRRAIPPANKCCPAICPGRSRVPPRGAPDAGTRAATPWPTAPAPAATPALLRTR